MKKLFSQRFKRMPFLKLKKTNFSKRSADMIFYISKFIKKCILNLILSAWTYKFKMLVSYFESHTRGFPKLALKCIQNSLDRIPLNFSLKGVILQVVNTKLIVFKSGNQKSPNIPNGEFRKVYNGKNCM